MAADAVVTQNLKPHPRDKVTLKQILDEAAKDELITPAEARERYQEMVDESFLRMGTRV